MTDRPESDQLIPLAKLMTLMTRTALLSILLLAAPALGLAQGLGPSTPSKEYIHFGEKVTAIENGYAPVAGLSTSTLTFGPQALDTPSLDQTVTLTNTGDQTLVFTGIPTIIGANAGDFSISGTDCIAGFVSMTNGRPAS